MNTVTLGQPVRILGQQAALPSIDKAFASSILEALNILLAEEEIPEAWSSEKCWINLRIRRWSRVVAFHERLVHFMTLSAQRLQITDAEEVLISDVMVCVETLLQKGSEEVESTVGLIATLVGVAGGLIAVGVALGIG